MRRMRGGHDHYLEKQRGVRRSEKKGCCMDC